MNRVIWSCWLQGHDSAPFMVRKCLESWAERNPDWDVRVLDASSIRKYIDLEDHLDLRTQQVTAASFSDIVRILLLNEYGGVWADATTYCNRALDEWLPEYMSEDFFAFSDPGPYLKLSSWFLARGPEDKIVGKWAARTLKYWSGRRAADNYFWFHNLFSDLVRSDPEAAATWEAVPRFSARGPHSLQDAAAGPADRFEQRAEWSAPLFKLNLRMDPSHWEEGTPIGRLLRSLPPTAGRTAAPVHAARPASFAGLKTKTENLGDHIQILAAEQLLMRAGVHIGQRIDRDDEIASAPQVAGDGGKIGILLNGWYKTNPREWPPSPRLEPIYLGFHVRPFQSPSLIAPPAVEHYRAHQPIGCRDEYTHALLSSLGVDCFVSNCLSLLFPRRIPDLQRQTEVFVVSRDDRLLELIPPDLGPVAFVSHYSGSSDFEGNLLRAAELLATYRDRARLIVTTLLHCALPAIAMGIPVVVFRPFQEDSFMQASDRQRFSSLERLVRVHSASEVGEVDWAGQVADVTEWKLGTLDALFGKLARWDLPPPPPMGPFAPAKMLPPP